MTPELVLQLGHAGGDIPDQSMFRAWAQAALQVAGFDPSTTSYGLTLRVVDANESQALNRRYRHQDKPTNVLSFPAELPAPVVAELPVKPLGDVVICADVVASEALAQQLLSVHHWAHLTIHGVLHLCGFDHQNEPDAQQMESLERLVMNDLGFPDPYCGERVGDDIAEIKP